jgi:hypothetical protein
VARGHPCSLEEARHGRPLEAAALAGQRRDAQAGHTVALRGHCHEGVARVGDRPGGARKALRGPGVPLGEFRHDPVPQPRPLLSRDVEVRLVLPPGLASGAQVLPQRLAAHAEEGPHDETAPRRHASREGRAAEGLAQEGLGLVVAGMRHHDGVGAELGRDAVQELVAHTPGGVLEVPPAPARHGHDVYGRRLQPHPQAAAQVGHERCVLRRGLTQTVVHVPRDHVAAGLQEQAQGRNGVGPARHGHQVAAPAGQELVQGRRHALYQRHAGTVSQGPVLTSRT